jgi:Thioredoxin-like
MLRSGYSSDAVLRELATRHFADVFDETVEQQLTRAGASESLINALRNGSHVATAAEISAAREKVIAQERQTKLVTQPTPRPQVPSSRTTPPSQPAAISRPPNAIYEVLQGNLVHLERSELRKLDDELVKKKKLYLLFYSSNSSELARAITSSLVTFYHRVASFHPEFEIIFLSQDRTAYAMDIYVNRAEMPWPAVVFEKTAGKIAGRRVVYEVPYLVLVSGDSKVLYSSSGAQNSDPVKVIADLDKVLATSSADLSAPPPRTLMAATEYFRPQLQ